ncbi:fructosamine kinase family protein [Nitrogeniibacter aestuarii]|uniref:fructosamine kinase family protein n=1 Tax=Nitrogeniibacter aestuarii TaxID=2815343 RepID=UPI001D1040BB|nr:fructosamine kinase family protein [Nitrogeniibacter aestuarii]
MNTARLDFIADTIRQTCAPAFSIAHVESVSGGSVHDSFSVLASDGSRYFVKTGDAVALDMFEAECDGLDGLRAPGCFKIPEVIAVHGNADHACLILEHLDLRPVGTDAEGKRFGEALAQLHTITNPEFGWRRDHYLGRTPLNNTWTTQWSRFLATTRFAPLLATAIDQGHTELKIPGEKLLNRLPALFANNPLQPALTHGDLWHGNAGMTAEGTPVLFDPATSFGDPDADLAMASLFGGFPNSFFLAYRAAMPAREDHAMLERLYRCFHLLNHLVLFGAAYKRETLRHLEWLNAWT